MSAGQLPEEVSVQTQGGVATVTFNRPQARNAMTWAMYQQLSSHCHRFKNDPSVRAVVFRGAGGQAFVAGTDIEQFKTFSNPEDGVAYEAQIEACIELLCLLPMPTVALIEGWAVGGGLAIATACDFRLATPGSQMGMPIAKTLGNCLSVANVARLGAAFGHQRVKRMLMLAEMISADEALACGYLHQLAQPEEIDAATDALLQRLTVLAPVTQHVSKQALNRIVQQSAPEAEDLIRQAYGSEDFREGVDAFVSKRKPHWKGR